MNKIERMRLISKIASTLQEQYTTSDINVFLAGFDIQNAGETIVPSKRIYVEQKLSFVSDDIIEKIASELNLITIQNKELTKHEIIQMKEKIIDYLTYVDEAIIDLILDEYNAPIHYSGDFDSKKDYIKFKISDFSPLVLVEIIEYLQKRKNLNKTPSFWGKHKIKMFISHLSNDKIKACKLSEELNKYNISCFVAHEDIEPNEEWLKCIEDALMSMDIMLALVTENFDKSKWTSQEIGFALGRNIPIISIKNGMDPFGFFGKKQAISGNGKMAKDIAKEIIDIVKDIPEFSEYIRTDI